MCFIPPPPTHTILLGASAYIQASSSITLLGSSSIHADKLGYSGGTPGNSDAQGTGAGGFGDLGGAGGSHGGVGVSGLTGSYTDELRNVYFTMNGGSVSTLSLSSAAFVSDGGSTYGYVCENSIVE